MNKKQERVNQILSVFNEKDCLSVKQLAERLNISEMTVRRDLSALQDANIIVRGIKAGTFSLASSSSHISENYELSLESTKSSAEKDRIGAFAATMIDPGEAVIIDTGTTTIRMVSHIPVDLEFSALCYNFIIFSELMKKKRPELTLVGGQINPATMSFSSTEGLQTIGQFRASKFFVSASGIHEKLGLTCGYRSELANKQCAIRSSLNIILLADSSKFGHVRSAYFGELDEIDSIVTDSNISEEWRELIKSKGIKLYIV